MNKASESIGDLIAITFTSAQISYSGIENVFSIICLVLTCLSILFGMVMKIVNIYKSKKKEDISIKDIEETIKVVDNGINEIKDEIEKVQTKNKEGEKK